MYSNSRETLSKLLPSVLETLSPDYSLFARIVALCFRTDISAQSSYILFFGRFIIPHLWVIILRLWNLYEKIRFSVSVEVKWGSTLLNPLIRWLSKNAQLQQGKDHIAGAGSAFRGTWYEVQEDTDCDKDFAKEQRVFEADEKAYWKKQKLGRDFRQIRYSPAQDQLHTFNFRGSIIRVRREARRSHDNTLVAGDPENIRLQGPSKQILHDLLEEVQKESLEQTGNQVGIYRVQTQPGTVGWTLVSSKSPRRLETLALDPQTTDKLVSGLRKFLEPRSKEWFSSRDLPYRRGYLFYGPPGTGKSSMCFVLAGIFCLDVYLINLNAPGISEESLSRQFQALPDRCIVLVEDADRAGIGSQGANQSDHAEGLSAKEKISMSALLNALDGVAAQEGRVLIMTTNHREKLDKALIRPGRVDGEFYFGYMSKANIEYLFIFFYGGPDVLSDKCEPANSTDQLFRDKISALSSSFANLLPADRFTPAEILNYLMDFKYDPDMAIQKVSAWVEDKLSKDINGKKRRKRSKKKGKVGRGRNLRTRQNRPVRSSPS